MFGGFPSLRTRRRRCWIRFKRSLLFLSFTTVVFIVVIGFFLFFNHYYFRMIFQQPTRLNRKGSRAQYYPDNILQKIQIANEANFETVTERENIRYIQGDSKPTLLKETKVIRDDQTDSQNISISTDVHIFYYGWYGNPSYDDGKWIHWNHRVLPPWNKKDIKKYNQNRNKHSPPDDIGANFYPQLGPYSSRNHEVIRYHVEMIRRSGCGVLVYSWYPPSSNDDQSFSSSDELLPSLLDIAEEVNIKVALHVEPFIGRNASTFRLALEYVVRRFGNHSAFYKRKKSPFSIKELPVYYIYDSYNLPSVEWQSLFSTRGDKSIRDTELDGIFLGLLVEFKHRTEIKRSKFDGFYTYFASNGFTHGSSWKNWKTLSTFANKNSLIFSPSIGPGYKDTRIRPWNAVNTRYRRKGRYYGAAWKFALNSGAKMFSITSFNEWHEGTQIEPAVPKTLGNYSYDNYEPNEPDYYLDLTSIWVKKVCKESGRESSCLSKYIEEEK
ncbi:glycoprotein endo-alpha-1,2-mannosidase [Lepeophtheirus salmonis]|uniref:glycoprotein endo-alpha-1,2-mannosidase n=1 Tax=Lepeophtheirus salmonis TaxID=72036 RepID=UPI001AE74660|nr:glycoprotein endo-alpha-1,2-mannosidase-like [Lepeophtheirus salmonis]